MHNVRVIIFGSHSQDWMKALSASSPVWLSMPEVSEVWNVEALDALLPDTEILGQPTVVIPLMENHIAFRPLAYSSFAPNLVALATLANKATFATYAEVQGLLKYCPKHFNSFEEASFPCVIKRTNLNASYGIEVVTCFEHSKVLLKHELFIGQPYIIQSQVVYDEEYVAHCVCKEGIILWHCVYATKNDGNYKITPALMRETSPPLKSHALLISVLELFLKPLSFSGPCNMDFTIDRAGNMIVFEINPRLGGSLMRPENVNDLRSSLSCIIQNALY